MHESFWDASTDPAIARGLATYSYAGETVKIHLENFQQFQAINKMLRQAFDDGVKEAIRQLDAEFSKTIQELRARYL